MKIKAHALVTSPIDFINHQDPSTIQMWSTNMSEYVEGSVNLGEIEIDFGDVDVQLIVNAAVARLDEAEEKTIAELNVKLERIKAERQNLLAITYQGE